MAFACDVQFDFVFIYTARGVYEIGVDAYTSSSIWSCSSMLYVWHYLVGVVFIGAACIVCSLVLYALVVDICVLFVGHVVQLVFVLY
jgi:hypothetical protein